MYNNGEPIGIDKLVQANLEGPHGAAVKMTETIANVALMATHQLINLDRPFTGGIAMTAFSCCSGIVQGEMEADGLVPEITDEALVKMLLANFKEGRELGITAAKARQEKKAEADRAAEVAKAADELAARGGKLN